MKDSFNREIDYLRISVTDLCNLRCVYCMPIKGVDKISHTQILTPERIKEIVEASAKLGIKKVRITGGEPLVRKGIIEIIKLIKSIPDIKEICLTTNGVLLKEMAKDLYDAGVDRLNISLDTLNEEKYHRITRVGELNKVIEGIEEANKVGFKNTKINCVLIGGFNDDEIIDFEKFASKHGLIVRFIELMPIGEGLKMGNQSFISNDVILNRISNLELVKQDDICSYYQVKGHKGIIGLISPLSHMFCDKCSRLRLTSDGKLKPCLHSSLEIDTNGYSGLELEEIIKQAILKKPKQHSLNEEGKSSSLRGMSKIGG